MRRRLVRLAIAVLGGILLGAGGLVAFLVLSNPGPRFTEDWELMTSMPDARGETAVAVIPPHAYVIGGLTGLTPSATAAVDVYDARQDAWSQAPDLPQPRHHAGAAALNGILYVSGGGPSATDWTPQPTMWALDPGADAWREVAPMPEGRLGHRMLAVGDRLYVVGGVSGSAYVLIYDAGADAWSLGAPLAVPRDHLAAVAVGTEIWAIGGRSSRGNHANVDIYDTVADAWRAGPPLPEPTSGAAEAAVGTLIYVSGGEDPSGSGGIIDRHWQLDTTAGDRAAWAPLTPPPLTVHGAQGAVVDGRFLIIGGALRQGAFSSVSWTSATQAYPSRQ